MGSTIVTVVMVATLAAWHLKTRRYANWKFCADARFYITSGYPLVAIAVYFLSTATTGRDGTWVLGNVWALVAMVAFVCGFEALNAHLRPGHTGASAEETGHVSPQDALHRR